MFTSQTWQSHADYLGFFHEAKVRFGSYQRTLLHTDYLQIAEKLRMLNLNSCGAYIQKYYSGIGRPAINQAQILRSFILFFFCVSKGFADTSLTHWSARVKQNELLASLIGCTCSSSPPLASYFDFIDRLWLAPRGDWYSRSKGFFANKNKSKTKEKLKKGDKAPDPIKNLVKILADRLLQGKRLTPNREGALQDIFYLTAVLPSVQCGLIPEENLTVSGDGTCIHTHANSCGHSLHKGCPYHDSCPNTDFCLKHCSDPDADWGWDSDLAAYYFGFTLYHLSCHNKELGVDLPLLIRFTNTKRHDSVNLLLALDDFKAHEPDLPVTNLCLDSAHDNYPTYELLKSWDIRAFIDLNQRRKGRKPVGNITFDSKGRPICQAGLKMISYGYDSSKHAHEWRCPYAIRGNPIACGCQCTKSKYGRVFYTKTDFDIRLYPAVARDTKKYQQIYNNRTACERVNNRILNDYKLHQMRIHNIKHYSFMTMVIGICIHLNARCKLVQKSGSAIVA